MFQSSPITTINIIATVIVSWQAFQQPALFERLLNNPYSVKHKKQYYRILSHALIHADFLHLGLNMFVLYSFGKNVEILFRLKWGIATGSILFLILYAGGAAVASLPSLKKHADNYGYNSVGASGAVSAVMMVAMILAPLSKVMLILLPIPMPAFIFIFVFFILEHVMSRRGKTNIAHDAHIWGAFFGIAFLLVVYPGSLVAFISAVRNYLF